MNNLMQKYSEDSVLKNACTGHWPPLGSYNEFVSPCYLGNGQRDDLRIRIKNTQDNRLFRPILREVQAIQMVPTIYSK
jgi:hypothetical protein